MHYSLDYIDIADAIYVYDEVNSKIYKISSKLLHKIEEKKSKDIVDIRLGIRQYMIENGIIKNSVIYDRIMDCSGYVDICELVLSSVNGKNQELADYICAKYHIRRCKMCLNEDVSSVEGNVENIDYTIEGILKILLVEKRCKMTDEMLNRVYDSWMEIKQDILNNIADIETDYYTNLVFDMISGCYIKYFPCEWGVDRLYIEDGMIYRCNQSKEKRIHINEINSVSSVDEYEPCKLCNMRYLCGGMCNTGTSITTRFCDFVRDVFHVLLTLYIMKKPENIIELT